MTIGIERFAVQADARTSQATYFKENAGLYEELRDCRFASQRERDWDGTVLVRLQVDDSDHAVVEVDAGSTPGQDSLATVEQAITHLEAVRRRLLGY